MADHEGTINNLRRTRFFCCPTTFNQGTHFIGYTAPQLNNLQLNRAPNFALYPVEKPTDHHIYQTRQISNQSFPTFPEPQGVHDQGQVSGENVYSWVFIQCVMWQWPQSLVDCKMNMGERAQA